MTPPATTPEAIAASALGRVPALVIELEDVRAGYTVGPATISTAIEPVGGGAGGGHDRTVGPATPAVTANRDASGSQSFATEAACPR